MTHTLSRSTLRDAWTLTRTELRTYVRHVTGETRQLVGVGFMVLAFGILFPLTFIGSAVAFGEALATGPVPLGAAGVAFVVVLSVASYVGAAGGLNQERVGQIGPLVRTSIPPLAVSLGRFANRSLQALAIFVPATLVMLGGVAVGAGGLGAPLLVAVAVVPLFAVGLVGGRIVGDILRYANERLQVSLWIKAVLTIGLMVVIFVGTQLLLNSQYEGGGAYGTVISGSVLPGQPLQAFASVVFTPLGADVRPLGLVVAGTTLVAIPIGLVVAMRLETRMLVRDLGSDAAGATQSHGVPHLFEVVPSARVAWRYLLRTRRDPRMLAHLSPLLFGAMGMAGSVVQDPGIALSLGPAAAVIAGAVLAGGAYGLNPLGDDRDQLPLLLTSTPSVGIVLRGRMIAGIVLGLVVAVGIGAPLGLVEHSPAYVLGQSVLAVFLATVSTGIAVGLGAVVPKFERREYMSVERAHPSQWAMMGFFFGGLVVGAIGFVLLWATLSGESILVVALGWLTYVAVLGLAAGGGYRYAVSRMDAFTLDDV